MIFFLGIIPSKFAQERLNGPVHINFNILKSNVASASEVETGGYFVTGRDVIILQKTLEEMVHQQPITQVCTENTTDTGISNYTTKIEITCIEYAIFLDL